MSTVVRCRQLSTPTGTTLLLEQHPSSTQAAREATLQSTSPPLIVRNSTSSVAQQSGTSSVHVTSTPRAAKAKQHEKRRIPFRSNTNQLAMAEHVDRARVSDERKRCRQLSTPTGTTPKQRPCSRLPLIVRNSTSSVAQQSGTSSVHVTVFMLQCSCYKYAQGSQGQAA